MIKVSRLADYAVVILAAMADSKESLLSASDISQSTNLPEPTVAKVLKLLSKADFLNSVRGANGGYQLARSTAQIKISSVIIAVDGPISLTACVEGSESPCDYAACCPVNGRWDQVNDAINNALADVSLADMLSAAPCCAKDKVAG